MSFSSRAPALPTTTLKTKAEFDRRLNKIKAHLAAVEELINKESKQQLPDEEVDYLDRFPTIEKSIDQLHTDLFLSSIDDTQNVLFDKVQALKDQYSRLEQSVVEVLARDLSAYKHEEKACLFESMIHKHNAEKPEVVASLHSDHYDVASSIQDNLVVIPDPSKFPKHFHAKGSSSLFFQFRKDEQGQRFVPDIKMSASSTKFTVNLSSEEPLNASSGENSTPKMPRPGKPG